MPLVTVVVISLGCNPAAAEDRKMLEKQTPKHSPSCNSPGADHSRASECCLAPARAVSHP